MNRMCLSTSDTFHMNIEEQDLSAAFLLAGERLGYVQLAE